MSNFIENLRELRQLTDYTVSMKACNAALEMAYGDISFAMDLLEDKNTFIFGEHVDTFLYCRERPERLYVQSIIYMYLSLGPELYRHTGAPRMPSKAWGKEILEEIESCFRQLQHGKGWSQDNPLENMGENGLYRAAEILHFKPVSYSVIHSSANDDQHTVCMNQFVMKHVTIGDEVIFYNKVTYDKSILEKHA